MQTELISATVSVLPYPFTLVPPLSFTSLCTTNGCAVIVYTPPLTIVYS